MFLNPLNSEQTYTRLSCLFLLKTTSSMFKQELSIFGFS